MTPPLRSLNLVSGLLLVRFPRRRVAYRMASSSSQPRLRYDGRVAVVTGAGGGLGRTYALLLASRGASVVVNDLMAAPGGGALRPADAVVAEIIAAGGSAAADYHSVTEGQAIIDGATQRFGRVDILVCNAGILRDASFAKMEESAWDAVVDVHLKGTYACTRAAWGGMRDRGFGRIVLVSSSSGVYGNFGQANYAAAKMGIMGLGSTLAREGEKRGVLVNTIVPIAASRMTEGLLPPDLLAALKPEAVAPLVAVLAHDACPVNGGVFELGAGWMSALRWERSKGAWMGSQPEGWTPEAVRSAWPDLVDFSPGVTTHPDSNTAAFEAIMKLLQQQGGGGGRREGVGAKASAPPATAASASTSSSSSALMAPLPGGLTGRSEAVDVPAARAHAFPPSVAAYTPRDAILYALSVGASANPALDVGDAPFTYELAREGEGGAVHVLFLLRGVRKDGSAL